MQETETPLNRLASVSPIAPGVPLRQWPAGTCLARAINAARRRANAALADCLQQILNSPELTSRLGGRDASPAILKRAGWPGDQTSDPLLRYTGRIDRAKPEQTAAPQRSATQPSAAKQTSPCN